MFGVLVCLWCYSFQTSIGAEPVPAVSWVWGEHGWQHLNQLAMHLEVPLYLCSLLFTINNLTSCLQEGAGGLCWLTAVLTNDTSWRAQEYSVTNFSNIVFSLSNLTFVPFRKPAWKDGSTATCVLAVDNILYIANLGDSRVSSMEKPTAGVSVSSRALFALKGEMFMWHVPDAMSSWTVSSKHPILGRCRVLLCCVPHLCVASLSW